MVKEVLDYVKDLLAAVLFILDVHLLLENLVDLLQEVGLPAEQLHRLDVVEALADVEGALFGLAALALAEIALRPILQVLDHEAEAREQKGYQEAIANLLIHDL